MEMPNKYKGGPMSAEESFMEKRSNSPVPSDVSLKSDKSMQMPINYNGDPYGIRSLSLEESFQDKRSNVSVPSLISLKSDKSMQMPINYNGDPYGGRPLSLEESFQDKISNMSVPSLISLKSDKSMQMPINFKESDTQKNILTSGPKEYMKNHILLGTGINGDGNSGEARYESDIPETHAEKLKSIFSEKYQHVLEGTTKQGNLVPLNEVYTELYITADVHQDLSLQHELNQIQAALKGVTGGTLINCSDIFKPLPAQNKPIRCVLTKGVAGIGKTVSVQKFLLDWAEGKANQDVYFIFPLPFKELNLLRDKKYSLNTLLQHFFMKEIDIIFGQLKNHSPIFIFDGLDECRLNLDFKNNETLCDATKTTSVDVLLTNLIKGNLFPSAHIWITSRPASANRIPTECVDRITDVQGFSDAQKEEYFRKRISDQSLANKIIAHLKTLRSLYIMCYIPVFCWIAATVLERMILDAGIEKIPKSLTQMYTYFLVTQINTTKTKYSGNNGTNQEMIFKLGKLAFDQLERGNLIFYEEDLRACDIDVREASVYSGLCTQIFREEFGLFQRKVYSFVHLSIQEHLAALHVFLSFHNNNKNVLDPQQKHPVTLSGLHKSAIDKVVESQTGDLDLFLRFLVGFSLESNQSFLQDLLVQRRSTHHEIQETIRYLKEQIKNDTCKQMSITFFHCLSELNDCALVEEIQTFLTKGDLHKHRLSNELWSAVVFILLTSDEKLNEFELGKYGKTDETLLQLLPVVRYSTSARFSNCDITVKGCMVLAVLLSALMTIKDLDLSNNNVQDSGLRLLCSGFQCHPQNMEDCDTITEESCNFLTSVLGIHPSCSQKLMQDNTIQLLLRFLKKITKKYSMYDFSGLRGSILEILRLCNCGVTAEGCGFLVPVLRSKSSHLRELDLSQNNIGDSGVKVLSNALQNVSCKLETLILNNCNLTAHCCAELGAALYANSNLKVLSLCDNELRDAGVKLLATGLKNPNCELETLMLSSCKVKIEGFEYLASALRTNPSHLRILDLSKNCPGDLGVKLLFTVLENIHCGLETLKLNECSITEKSFAALTSFLSSESSCLQKLDLSANDLKDLRLISDGLGRLQCKLQL